MSTPQRKTPLKRKPLVRRPKAKGNRYEKEIRDLLREEGYRDTKRNLQSGGQGGGDLIESIPGYSIECKRQERLNIWAALAQAEKAGKPTDTPLVIFKRNRSISYAALPLADLLPLIEASQA